MSGHHAASKVLTLVFTDLADSTALKTRHGDAVVEALIARHTARTTELAAECGGRIIDWAGDGCFLTFETSSAATVFALRLQMIHAAEPDLPPVRIGIHMGEVTEKITDGGALKIIGLAVDIAARVCGLARPGQVLMSAAVYDSARQRIGAESLGKPVVWQAHGAYALKGFDKHVEIGEARIEGDTPLAPPASGDKARRVRRAQPEPLNRGLRAMVWTAALVLILASSVLTYSALGRKNPGEDTPPLSPDPPEARIRSLAVLPLDNLSGDPEQEYFADGMTEAITSELGKIKSLKVVSRTSVMRFKNTEVSMREIGQTLGVDGVIEGSVQREDNRVRITVQLIHAPTDVHVWTQEYTDTITSVLALQSEVALAIADALQAELTGEERTRVARSAPVKQDAYDQYLLGLYNRELGTPAGIMASIRHFDRATQLDPNFAEAWGRLGQAYCLVAGSGAVSPGNLFPRARTAALNGLQLDGDLPSAHNALGICAMMYDWEWEQAESHFRKSVDVDPNGVFGHLFLSMFLSWMGRNTEALPFVRKALDLGSADPWVVVTAGQVLFVGQHLEEARTYLEQTLAERTDFVPAMLPLIAVYESMGQPNKAIEMATRAVELDKRGIGPLLRAALLRANAGNTDEAKALLGEALNSSAYIEPGYLYPVYVVLGDFDAAFEAINNGVEARAPGLVSLRTLPYSQPARNNPNFNTFRTDPRYRELLERLKFPPLPKDHPGYDDEQNWIAQKSAQTTP